jgi:hypothetical protein
MATGIIHRQRQPLRPPALAPPSPAPAPRQPMLHYLKISEKPNKKEAGGVLKWFVTLKPSCSLDQMNCALEVVRWISRHHRFDKFVDFFAVAKPRINLALMKCFEHARKKNM